MAWKKFSNLAHYYFYFFVFNQPACRLDYKVFTFFIGERQSLVDPLKSGVSNVQFRKMGKL